MPTTLTAKPLAVNRWHALHVIFWVWAACGFTIQIQMITASIGCAFDQNMLLILHGRLTYERHFDRCTRTVSRYNEKHKDSEHGFEVIDKIFHFGLLNRFSICLAFEWSDSWLSETSIPHLAIHTLFLTSGHDS